jgi:hypothetical protein
MICSRSSAPGWLSMQHGHACTLAAGDRHDDIEHAATRGKLSSRNDVQVVCANN